MPDNPSTGSASRRAYSLFLMIVVAAAAACSEPMAPPPAGERPQVSITVLSGDGQQVPIFQQFPEPVRALIRIDGAPAANARIRFQLNEGTTFSTMHELSDSEGIVTVQPQTHSTAPSAYTLFISFPWCTRWNPAAGIFASPTCANEELLGLTTVTGNVVAQDGS